MAEQVYSTNVGLSTLPELDQSKDPLVYAELLRLRNAVKVLQGALDNYTGALGEDPAYWSVTSPASSLKLQNLTRVYVEATEAMAYGQAVNFWDSSGLKARLADANPARPCRAYCNVVGGVGIGDFGEFILGGLLPSAGVIPGASYYMATVAGSLTSVLPITPGDMFQSVGFGLDTTTIWFAPSLDWYII